MYSKMPTEFFFGSSDCLLRAVGMLQTGMSWRDVVRALKSCHRPFCVFGHYFSRRAMFRGDQKLDTEGNDPLHKTGKFSYVFLI